MSNSIPPTRLRAGIVGAGLISDIHLSGLARLDNVEIVGIADSDLQRAREKAGRYGVPAAFATQREMLDGVAPDVVHVLTPQTTHAELCIEAFDAGAHVYVEKPMASSEQDCDAMIAAASRTGREICVGHCMVFDPLMQRALRMLESGEAGEVRHAAAVYCFDPGRIPGYDDKLWYRQLTGGFLEDLASHPASLLHRVLGAAGTVTAAVDVRPGAEGQELAALVDAERGIGTLTVSLGTRPEEVSLEIRATRAVLRLNFSTMVLTVQKERALPKKLAHGIKNLEMAAQLATQTVTSTFQFIAGRLDTTKGVHTLIHEFYGALASGRPAPVSGEEGRQVVRLLRAVWPDAEAPAHVSAGAL